MRRSFRGGSSTGGVGSGGVGQRTGGELGRRVEKELGGQPDKKVLTLAPHLQVGLGGEGGLSVEESEVEEGGGWEMDDKEERS
jgi:hypothetical protein